MKLASAVIVVSGMMMLVAPQSFADSVGQSTFFASGHAAQVCAGAAASAQITGRASAAQIAACTSAIRMADNSTARLTAAYTNRAILHLVRAEYQDSLADSDSALQIDGQLVEAIVNRGVAMLFLHRPAEAAAEFTRALSLNAPDQAKIYFNRAMAREDSSDFRGAYTDYSEAARLAPQWDRPKQELSRFTVTPRTPVS